MKKVIIILTIMVSLACAGFMKATHTNDNSTMITKSINEGGEFVYADDF